MIVALHHIKDTISQRFNVRKSHPSIGVLGCIRIQWVHGKCPSGTGRVVNAEAYHRFVTPFALKRHHDVVTVHGNTFKPESNLNGIHIVREEDDFFNHSTCIQLDQKVERFDGSLFISHCSTAFTDNPESAINDINTFHIKIDSSVLIEHRRSHTRNGGLKISQDGGKDTIGIRDAHGLHDSGGSHGGIDGKDAAGLVD